jgi:hypothetical protein
MGRCPKVPVGCLFLSSFSPMSRPRWRSTSEALLTRCKPGPRLARFVIPRNGCLQRVLGCLVEVKPPGTEKRRFERRAKSPRPPSVVDRGGVGAVIVLGTPEYLRTVRAPEPPRLWKSGVPPCPGLAGTGVGSRISGCRCGG